MFLWLFGPIIWATHLFVLYGGATIICRGVDASRHMQIRWLAGVLTALALAALLGFAASQFLAKRQDRSGHEAEVTVFLQRTALALVGLAIIGILWSAASAILLPTCAAG
jgi:hypothetical protein